MDHYKSIKTSDHAEEMNHVLHVADDIAPGLVLEGFLLCVKPVQSLKVSHPFFLRFVREYDVFSFEFPLLDSARIGGFLILTIKDLVKKNTCIDSVIGSKQGHDEVVEGPGALEEEILLIL